MRYSILSAFIFAAVCVGGTATQTDWSGGGGTAGPVTEWGNEFYSDTDVIWSISQGEISTPISEYLVEDMLITSTAVRAIDIDNDGDMDVIIAAENGKMRVKHNLDGLGTSWWDFTTIEGGTCNINVYDLDGDGDLDLAGHIDDPLLHCVNWIENTDGLGKAWDVHEISTFTDVNGSCISDIDGDGYYDLLAVSDSHIKWWENDGLAANWIQHDVVSFTGASVSAGDIDGDGSNDIVSANIYAQPLTWWENSDGIGTTWVEHIITTDMDDCPNVYVIDFDIDGDMDVLAVDQYMLYGLRWWENTDGSGDSWSEHIIFNGEFIPFDQICCVDLDGDNDNDILHANSGFKDDYIDEYSITWRENLDGVGTSWVEHTIDDYFYAGRAVDAGDFDDDGLTDVVSAGYYGFETHWWKVLPSSGQGCLESSIFNLQEPPIWGEIDWTATEPTGTSVSFQVRASNNSEEMGEWSDTLTSPGSLSGILADQDSLFQYRVILTSSEHDTTPILEDVTINWLPWTSIEEEQSGILLGYEFGGANPNPAYGSVQISFQIPVDDNVHLTVYDFSGRLISESEASYHAGFHRVYLNSLTSGIYLIKMHTAGFDEIRKVVVIN